MKKSLLSTLVFILALSAGTVSFQTANAQSSGYEIETVTTEVDVPWGMTWLPNGDMLVTNRGGELYHLRNGEVVGTIDGVPEVCGRPEAPAPGGRARGRLQQPEGAHDPRAPMHPAIRRALDLMNRPAAPASLPGLAAACGVSDSTLSRLFRRERIVRWGPH